MLDKNFDPKSFENNFSFELEASIRKPDAEPFMVLLPPPNVTGSLHVGHALCYTLQDIIARYKRLRGFDVLFQPGLDHAGIVTQLLVEKKLYDGGVPRGTLTREALLKEIWLWKESSGGAILDQMKILGISCDFSGLRFTLDEESKRAVTKLFVKLYNDGLIYLGERMINWDPAICSAISDLEVVEREVPGSMWYIRYMLEHSNNYIVVATTRPETIFGDVAVAVNPSDERYASFVGRNVVLPLVGKVIPIIADAYADPSKGTGAVKITPAHDFNDYEVGKRHDLPIVDIMNHKGELQQNVPDMFCGLDRLEARKLVISLLKKKDLLERTESIKHILPFGDRSGALLEPRITKQWFIRMEQMASNAVSAVRDGRVNFLPKYWENLYFEWLHNIEPWCISRQIWWGHRIPAWYGPDGQVFVAESLEQAKAAAVKFYGKNVVHLEQDSDVLDTWFSSAMWPFVTLGWPNDSEAFKKFYSNTVVVTGFDIIFFWIARMVMFGIYATGEIPFKNVYIHGLVRDEKGQKMSKSKKNIIDPLDLCAKYGADALRYTFASLASPGRDIKMTDKSVELGRNFLTKLWNVVRFAQMNGCFYNKEFNINEVKNPLAKWIIFKVQEMVKNIEQAIDDYRFDEMSGYIYHCLWDCFCDWYMELIKPILSSSATAPEILEGYDLQQMLLKKDIRDATAWAIVQFVQVLYPITPFIAKKLCGELGVMEITWPDFSGIATDFTYAVKEIEFIREIVGSIRSLKQYLQIPVFERINVQINAINAETYELLKSYRESVATMAGVNLVDAIAGEERTISVVLNDGATVLLGLGERVDISREKERLIGEIKKMEKIRNDAMAKLSNADFLDKASDDVVTEHRKRVDVLSRKIEKISGIISNL
ncbi:MAG: valine--tRNA ligase [Holosporaceae bacterium]|jgi:valyl-tRNA synthetase|nr:valine--tRNA ligase [Holosporaceae bacterium]